jgi:hypothetical protein
LNDKSGSICVICTKGLRDAMCCVYVSGWDKTRMINENPYRKR